MSEVFVHGLGAVSPAGWNLPALSQAIQRGKPIATKDLARPGREMPHRVRRVPKPPEHQVFLAHPRMRRASPITRFMVSAALEALAENAALVKSQSLRLGIVCCVMSGCVNYSRRFYDETLRDPQTASPLVFPETVFNAPSSHLAALLGSTAINYTLVGDPGVFLQGVALGANWLHTESIDACLVVGAEELDWLTVDAFRLFTKRLTLSEGAGAIHLQRRKADSTGVTLQSVTAPRLFTSTQSRTEAAAAVRKELPSGSPEHLLCDSTQGVNRLDQAELKTWTDWPGPRLSPKTVLGEGLMAAAAWQTVLAAHAVQQKLHPAAHVSVVGCNQQAIGACFTNGKSRS